MVVARTLISITSSPGTQLYVFVLAFLYIFRGLLDFKSAESPSGRSTQGVVGPVGIIQVVEKNAQRVCRTNVVVCWSFLPF